MIRRTDSLAVLLEGLFLGIALILLVLVFEDRKSGQGWNWRELLLAGVALGMALGGAWIEIAI